MSVMDFKLNFYKGSFDINQTEGLAHYVNQMIEELNKIDDEVLREITIKKLSKEASLEEDFIRSKLIKKEIKKETKKQIIKTSKYEEAQLGLLFYMLKSGEVIKMYDNQTFYFPNQNYRLLAKEISYFYNKFGYINEAEIMDDLNLELTKVIGMVENQNLSEEYSKNLIEDYINAIKEVNIEDECKRLTKKWKKQPI